MTNISEDAEDFKIKEVNYVVPGYSWKLTTLDGVEIDNPLNVTVTKDNTASSPVVKAFTNNYDEDDGPDKIVIDIEKAFSGIAKEDIPAGFQLVLSYSLEGTTQHITLKKTDVTNISEDAEDFKIKEVNYVVPGYSWKLTTLDGVEIDNPSEEHTLNVTAPEATMEEVTGDRDTKEGGGKNYKLYPSDVMLISLTGNQGEHGTLVVSQNSLNKRQRDSIEAKISNMQGSFKTPAIFFSGEQHQAGFYYKNNTITFKEKEDAYWIVHVEHPQSSMEKIFVIAYSQNVPLNSAELMNEYEEDQVPVDIIKVAKNTLDSETKTYLEGAEFTITQLDENGSGDYKKEADGSTKLFFTKTVTTDDNGKVTCDNLLSGYYEIKETKAPGGYVMTPEAAYIKVSGGTVQRISKAVDDATTDKDESKVVNWPTVLEASTEGMIRFKAAKAASGTAEATNAAITVGNDQGVELPQTGGIGTTLFTALGGLMTATAGAILTMKSYRRRKENA